MPHQVIVRYCPDCVRGEFVNIGACVYDINHRDILSAFLEDVDRMADFFGMTSHQAYKIVSSLADESLHWTPAFLSMACHDCQGSIVFSEPRGTLLDRYAALADAASRYLHFTKGK